MKTITNHLRDLSPFEIYDLFKLRVDVFVVEQQCPYPEIDQHDTQCVHLQMRDEANVLAAYCRIIEDGSIVHIGRVIVHPDYRAQKLGKKLMNAALDYVETMAKITDINLSAQSHLQHFYASFGFKSTSEIYEEDGIPHINMAMKKHDRISK